MFLPQEIIRKKRDGVEITPDEIMDFINGIRDNDVTDAQIAAFCMAVYFNEMTISEMNAMCNAITHSGEIMSWDFNGPVVDKHSTGGVGDLTSLLLGPMIAACGGYVPMISGRGLGHTGGTLDKLEAIPGFNVYPSKNIVKSTLTDAGIIIMGQTPEYAPAEKRIYATRDTTATVESIPLIAACIMAKKLTEGLNAFVMDVKAGSGAFMPSYELSRKLAVTIGEIAKRANCPSSVLITDMSQPLARSAGNSLELFEVIDFLSGKRRDKRLFDVTMALSSHMLINSGLVAGITDAETRLLRVLDDGSALERFARMIAGQGGPVDFVENSSKYLAASPVIKAVTAEKEGYIHSMDTREIGMAIVGLGGGRSKPSDSVDFRVGISEVAELGTKIDCHTPLVTIHARTEGEWNLAAEKVRDAIHIADDIPDMPPVIYERLHFL